MLYIVGNLCYINCILDIFYIGMYICLYICHVDKDNSNILICFVNVKNKQPILIVHEASIRCPPPSS